MLEYEPAAQGVHAVLPVALECVPLAHGLHVSELFAPVSVEYVPAGQSSQTLAHGTSSLAIQHAGITAYLPASHAAQPVTLSPAKPGPHTHVALPAADVVFAGHSCLSDVPPGQK